MKKKKILMLNYEFPPLGGGAANATKYILREFSKYKDIEIDLVTSSIDEERVEEFSKNITIHYLDIGKKGNLHYQSNKDLLIYSKKAYSYSKELIEKLAKQKGKKKKKKYDLIHAFFGIPCGFIALGLKRKYKIPYIVSLRGTDVPFYNRRFYILDKLFFKRMSKKIWKEAKAVVANSEGLKDLARNTSKFQDIEVIYNGIDINEFREKEQRKKKENEKIRLICTNRLIKRKGYEFLIDAVSNLENVEVWFVADGNLKNELKQRAEEMNSNVKFWGKRNHEEIPGFLRKADIFVLPSLNEGMSNSILEAMASGLPIITTDTGGSKELVKKENGVIIKKEDSDDIKKAIEKYLKNKDLILKQGRYSRKIAEGMKWDNVAKDYFEIYRLCK